LNFLKLFSSVDSYFVIEVCKVTNKKYKFISMQKFLKMLYCSYRLNYYYHDNDLKIFIGLLFTRRFDLSQKKIMARKTKHQIIFQ